MHNACRNWLISTVVKPLILMMSLVISVWANTPLSNCGPITTADTYTLAGTLSSASTCLSISNVHQVTLDCQSFGIIAGNASNPAITVDNKTPYLLLDSCELNHPGLDGSTFVLAISSLTSVYISSGAYESIIQTDGIQTLQLSKNVFSGTAGQNCANNPLICVCD